MAKTLAQTGKLKYLMGVCMPSSKTHSSRIKIPVYEYDDFLHMYFKKNDFVYAYDPDKICNVGDTVLIQTLAEKMTRLITHKVIEVVYPIGDITDPITGKKVAGSKYRDDIKEANKLYGESDNAFDYDKAPPHGYLKDTRDFTHKPVYKKYYEDPNDPQPYGVS